MTPKIRVELNYDAPKTVPGLFPGDRPVEMAGFFLRSEIRIPAFGTSQVLLTENKERESYLHKGPES